MFKNLIYIPYYNYYAVLIFVVGSFVFSGCDKFNKNDSYNNTNSLSQAWGPNVVAKNSLAVWLAGTEQKGNVWPNAIDNKFYVTLENAKTRKTDGQKKVEYINFNGINSKGIALPYKPLYCKNFTLSFWFKINSPIKKWRKPFLFSLIGSKKRSNRKGWAVICQDDTLRWMLVSGGSKANALLPKGSIKNHEWNFAFWSCSGDDSRVGLNNYSTNFNHFSLKFNNTECLDICGNASEDIYISDVRFYKRSLTEKEMLEIYKKTLALY